jgi:cytochrome c oxidase cbb3-type subunit 3
VRVSALQPSTGLPSAPVSNPYEGNAYALSEGQRLFTWYNCVGCHAHGGGGSGPALMDSIWIYGDSPEQIYASIVQGRPNGMPSFGGHIPDYQVWQLVTYVRSLSMQEPKWIIPSRTDNLEKRTGKQ